MNDTLVLWGGEFGHDFSRSDLADASTDGVRVRGVVRAHQHAAELNPLMSRLVASDGVFRHWQENESTADSKKSASETGAGVQGLADERA